METEKGASGSQKRRRQRKRRGGRSIAVGRSVGSLRSVVGG